MRIGVAATRLMIAGLATALAGCASSPPPRPAALPLQPVAGETQQAIAERAFLFVAVYQFESGGSRYALGQASDMQQKERYQELVFVDGLLSCARQRRMAVLSDLDSELTEWERVAEPGGLEHLAAQLRNACASERVGSTGVAEEGSEVPEHSHNAASGTPVESSNSRSEAELAAGVLVHSLEMAYWIDPTMLLLTPVVLLAVGISNLVENASTEAAKKLEAEWRSATTIEDVMKLLGDPVVEFSLPAVNTQVMAYRLSDVHPYYVGISGGKPIWVHNEHPWLHGLATQAIEQGKTKARGKKANDAGR